jgi:hypothetical protein
MLFIFRLVLEALPATRKGTVTGRTLGRYVKF